MASTRQLLDVGPLFYVLMLFCNNPHYMATIYRAYRTRDDFSGINLAVLSAQAGDSRRAEEQLLRALRLDSNHADTHLNLAEVYMARGEFARAIPRYRAFLGLAGQSGQRWPHLRLLVLLKLGDALAANGRSDEARTALSQLRALADQQGESDLASAARARLTFLENR